MNDKAGYYKDDEGNDVISFGDKKIFGKSGIVLTGATEEVTILQALTYLAFVIVGGLAGGELILHFFCNLNL